MEVKNKKDETEQEKHLDLLTSKFEGDNFLDREHQFGFNQKTVVHPRAEKDFFYGIKEAILDASEMGYVMGCKSGRFNELGGKNHSPIEISSKDGNIIVRNEVKDIQSGSRSFTRVEISSDADGFPAVVAVSYGDIENPKISESASESSIALSIFTSQIKSTLENK